MKSRNLLDVELSALEKLQCSNEKKISRLEKISNSPSDLIQIHLDFMKLLDKYPGESRQGSEFNREFQDLCKRQDVAKVNHGKYVKMGVDVYSKLDTLKIENMSIAARINHRTFYEKSRNG